jgi:hypothetical protein
VVDSTHMPFFAGKAPALLLYSFSRYLLFRFFVTRFLLMLSTTHNYSKSRGIWALVFGFTVSHTEHLGQVEADVSIHFRLVVETSLGAVHLSHCCCCCISYRGRNGAVLTLILLWWCWVLGW